MSYGERNKDGRCLLTVWLSWEIPCQTKTKLAPTTPVLNRVAEWSWEEEENNHFHRRNEQMWVEGNTSSWKGKLKKKKKESSAPRVAPATANWACSWPGTWVFYFPFLKRLSLVSPGRSRSFQTRYYTLCLTESLESCGTRILSCSN